MLDEVVDLATVEGDKEVLVVTDWDVELIFLRVEVVDLVEEESDEVEVVNVEEEEEGMLPLVRVDEAAAPMSRTINHKRKFKRKKSKIFPRFTLLHL